MNKLYFFILITLSFCTQNFANEQESGWLKNETGSTEKKLGARVDSVQVTGDGQRIQVSLPKRKKPMEEVFVIGKKEKKSVSSMPLIKIHNIEVINDLDSGRNGIVFYLGERGDFVFKFNYQEADPIYLQRQ
ncbi:MAG: hypothetical protein ACI92E_001684 [Oceanicoccus sp.]